VDVFFLLFFSFVGFGFPFWTLCFLRWGFGFVSQKRERDFSFLWLFVLRNEGSRVVVSLCCDLDNMGSPKKREDEGKKHPDFFVLNG
jgi:hypothetical protein